MTRKPRKTAKKDDKIIGIFNQKKISILRLLDGKKSIYSIHKSLGLAYSTTFKHVETLGKNGFASKESEKWSRTKAGTGLLHAIDEGAGVNANQEG